MADKFKALLASAKTLFDALTTRPKSFMWGGALGYVVTKFVL